jgi:hypothetical protein
MDSTEEMITIPKAELDRLKTLEDKYTVIKPKYDKLVHNNVERVNAYNKAHPEKVLARAHKYINKDRDAYNARRRERYRLKKEAAAAAENSLTAAGGCSTTMAVKPPDENPGPK